MKFQYVAVKPDRSVVKGTINASSKNAAKALVEVNKLEVMLMQEVKKKKVNVEFAFGHTSDVQLLFFIKHLSIMLKAGLPIFEALVMLKDQAKGKLKNILGKVIDEVSAGQRLSDVLEKYPKDFPGLVVQLIRAGELSGTLEENLDYIATFMRKEIELKKKVKGAMLYPTIILLAVVALIIGIGLFVMPQILPLFESLDVKLPTSTKILIWFAEFFRDYGVLTIIVTIVTIFLLPIVLSNKYVKPLAHRFYLRIPIIGEIVRQVNLARFSVTLATLLNAGITIDGALKISNDIIKNEAYRFQIREMRKTVMQGSPMSQAVKRSSFYFPSMITHMIRVGERSGRLAESLEYVGVFYNEEVDDKMKNLGTILEPILLIFIGLMVGGVAMAILGPIYSLTGNIR